MTAPAFVASASGQQPGGTTVSVVIPASAVSGQRALLVLTLTPSAPSADPSGWTALANTLDNPTSASGRMYLWTTTISSTTAVDPGDTVTVTLQGSSRATLAVYVAEASILDGSVAIDAPGGTGVTSHPSPVATASDSARVIHFYGVCSQLSTDPQASWTPDAATTERVDRSSESTTSRNATVMIADETIAAPGSTTSRTATSSQSIQPARMTAVLKVNVDRPVANAGPDQSVLAGALVTLNGTATNGAGAPFTYTWRQISGTTVTLSSTTAEDPTFTAPSASGDIVLGLIVTDTAAVQSIEDTVTISVTGAEDTAVPVTDVTVTGWSKEPTGAADYSTVISDGSDATYAYYTDPAGTVILEVGLTALAEPAPGEPVTIGYRTSIFQAASGSVTVILKEGASTVIASFGPDVWSVTDTVQQFEHTLSQAQIDSIVNFSNLRLRFEGSITV